MTFQTTVTDPTGAGIPGLLVTATDEMNGKSFPRSTDGTGYADVAMPGCPVGDRVTLSILDPQLRFTGYVAGDALTITAANQTITVTLQPFKRPARPGHVVVLVPRGALPPFPAGSFDRVLPFTPPVGPDRLFYRGQFCGLRLPGAPAVVGGPADPALMMACLLDRYPRAWQDAFLQHYAACGYTHLQRSIGHALPFGAWGGVTLDAFLELTGRAQAAGLFADQWFLGGEALMTRDGDAAYWQPILDPLIDAMLAAHAIDTACVGWQLDAYNAIGPPIRSIIQYCADKVGPHDIPLGTHWMNEAGGWWDAHEPGYGGSDARFVWWQSMRNQVLWFHHQGDTTMARTDPKLYQDKLKDTLDPFGDGRMGTSGLFGDRPFGVTVFECSAQDQFNGVTSEDEGDLVGYLICCATGTHGAHVSGYGNGARRPDGTAL
jgi:hypothetical protein